MPLMINYFLLVMLGSDANRRFLKHLTKLLMNCLSSFFSCGNSCFFLFVLLKVRLVDAGFVWTEPHSKRLKVKLTIQKEVSCV